MNVLSVAVAGDVVLCGGALHPFVADRVACPITGALTPRDACAVCRHLTWRIDDRVRSSICSTEPQADG
jgi:hypothetical protein